MAAFEAAGASAMQPTKADQLNVAGAGASTSLRAAETARGLGGVASAALLQLHPEDRSNQKRYAVRGRADASRLLSKTRRLRGTRCDHAPTSGALGSARPCVRITCPRLRLCAIMWLLLLGVVDGNHYCRCTIRRQSLPPMNKACRCLTEYGLRLHIDACLAKNPASCDRGQFASINLVRRPCVYARMLSRLLLFLCPQTLLLRTVNPLCNGKVKLTLPRPEPLPQGWAACADRVIVYKSPEQMLYLMEGFPKNKAEGCTSH